MKRILCIPMMIALLLTGCANTGSSSEKSEITQPCTIKWCLTECGVNDDVINKLNEELRNDGCQYEIELVQIEHSAEKTYAEQVAEYEKLNGSLDVVSAGYAFSSNASAGYDFIKSGYFMPIDDVSEFTLVPEKLWETVKVNGNIYTVPSLAFNDSGVTCYFNKAYISVQQFSDFDGNISELGGILDGLTGGEDFLPIYYNIEYTDFAKSFPYTAKGGLLLDNANGGAVNPYQFEVFTDYARTLNKLYTAGLFGKKINFSKYDYRIETPPDDFAVMVSPTALSEQYLTEMGFADMELYSFSLPVYLENRVLYSMGIAQNSQHREQAADFLKRLYSDTKYATLLYENGAESMSIGIADTDVKANYDNAFVSDFAGFELSRNCIDMELKDVLVSSFDRLCKSDNFDETLSEINAELNAAGIDDYLSEVNELLEENNASANQ